VFAINAWSFWFNTSFKLATVAAAFWTANEQHAQDEAKKTSTLVWLQLGGVSVKAHAAVRSNTPLGNNGTTRRNILNYAHRTLETWVLQLYQRVKSIPLFVSRYRKETVWARLFWRFRASSRQYFEAASEFGNDETYTRWWKLLQSIGSPVRILRSSKFDKTIERIDKRFNSAVADSPLSHKCLRMHRTRQRASWSVAAQW
jgi:hypothetical protein